MFRCFILFDDPILVGKYSQLLGRISEQIQIEKVIDLEQIKLKFNTEDKNIIISSYENIKLILENELTFDLKFAITDEQQIDMQDEGFYCIQPKFVITKMGTILNDYIQEKLSKIEYIPLSIQKIRCELTYPCNFFLKINNEKYLKIGKANQQMEEKILQKLLFKGAKYLYIEKQDYDLLLDFLKERSKNSSEEIQQSDTNIKATETIHDYILDMGFDPKIVEMTKTLHSSIEEKFSEKFMQALLHKFASLEGSFLYNHSYLTATLCLTVGQKFTWMNYDNREKLYLGSILHDLGYTNKDNATFESMSKTAINTLDAQIKDDVLKHPTLFAQKLAQVNDIHQDVIKMVKDHHGTKGENSYPKQIYPNEINLIFALFVLSHEFSLKLFRIAFNPKKVPLILEELISEFDKGNYRKILPEFKATVESLF